ncbi:TPA: hypothetical protein DDW35_07845 [Candidatus Sumerlaeota bacterium]|nr:hypothetical protein [Candidatus Sumerlaeota bacterium]
MLKSRLLRCLFASILMLFLYVGGLAVGQTANDEKKVELSGKVVDLMTGKPVPGIQIRCRNHMEGNGQHGTVADMTTNDTGFFSTQVAAGASVRMDLYPSLLSSTGKCLLDSYWASVQNFALPFDFREVLENKKDIVFKVKLRSSISLQGQVVDSNGLAITDSVVYAGHEGKKTDANGNFVLEAVPADQDFDLFAITEKENLAGITRVKAGSNSAKIVLVPTKNYTGEARTANDLPAEKLNFGIQPVVNYDAFQTVNYQEKTNENGTFGLKNLCPLVKYKIYWDAHEYEGLGEALNRSYERGEALIDLTKIPAGQPIKFQAPMFTYAVLGRVVNTQNQPIAGAKVRTLQEPGVVIERWYPGIKRTQETDKDGRFTIERLAFGNVPLHITAPGYQGQTVVTQSNNTNFTATLLPPRAEGAKIEVALVDEQDSPISKATVRLNTLLAGIDEKATTIQTVATHSEGKAFFALQKSAESSKNYLTFDAPGYCLAWREIPVNEDASLIVRLKKEGRPRHGRLLDENGKPMTHERLCVPEWAKAGIDSVMECDAEGRFTVKRVAENDDITLDLIGSKYICNQQHPLRFSEYAGVENEIDLVLMDCGGTIRGTVRLPDGSPAPGNWYINTARTPVQWTGSGSVTGGYFEISNLPTSGMWRIDASPGWDNATGKQWICPAPIELKVEPNKITETSITLMRGIPISGKFVFPDGQKKSDSYTLLAETSQDKGRKYPTGHRFESTIRGEDADKPWTLYLPEGEFEFKYATSDNPQYVSSGVKVTVKKDTPVNDVAIEMKVGK